MTDQESTLKTQPSLAVGCVSLKGFGVGLVIGGLAALVLGAVAMPDEYSVNEIRTAAFLSASGSWAFGVGILCVLFGCVTDTIRRAARGDFSER